MYLLGKSIVSKVSRRSSNYRCHDSGGSVQRIYRSSICRKEKCNSLYFLIELS